MSKGEIVRPRKLPAGPPADDGPDDMELTVPKKPETAINTANSVFDEAANGRFGGINTKASVFKKDTLFNTGS
jgi:hypothetical protein